VHQYSPLPSQSCNTCLIPTNGNFLWKTVLLTVIVINYNYTLKLTFHLCFKFQIVKTPKDAMKLKKATLVRWDCWQRCLCLCTIDWTWSVTGWFRKIESTLDNVLPFLIMKHPVAPRQFWFLYECVDYETQAWSMFWDDLSFISW